MEDHPQPQGHPSDQRQTAPGGCGGAAPSSPSSPSWYRMYKKIYMDIRYILYHIDDISKKMMIHEIDISYKIILMWWHIYIYINIRLYDDYRYDIHRWLEDDIGNTGCYRMIIWISTSICSNNFCICILFSSICFWHVQYPVLVPNIQILWPQRHGRPAGSNQVPT